MEFEQGNSDFMGLKNEHDDVHCDLFISLSLSIYIHSSLFISNSREYCGFSKWPTSFPPWTHVADVAAPGEFHQRGSFSCGAVVMK